MLNKTNPTHTESWKKLTDHFGNLQELAEDKPVDTHDPSTNG